MQINISSEQQLKSMLTDKGVDFDDGLDDDQVQMGEVPILAHRQTTPSGADQVIRDNDYDQAGRASS